MNIEAFNTFTEMAEQTKKDIENGLLLDLDTLFMLNHESLGELVEWEQMMVNNYDKKDLDVKVKELLKNQSSLIERSE